MDEKARVLYIEDDWASQRLVNRVLSDCGYEVFVADDGLKGVDLAQKIHPHLILMDIHLPHMDGRAVTTRLRSLSHLTDIPIVALTANATPGSRELALAAGCIGFLTKPIDVDEFPQQIQLFLKGCRHTLDDEERNQHLEKHVRQVVEQLDEKIRELESANQMLFKLDRMKSDFIILAAHELRTPLTLVSGYAHVLKEQLAQEDDIVAVQSITPIVESLNSGVGRMTQVVDEIIRVSRIAAGLLDLALGPVQLAQIIEEITDHFQSVCRQRRLDLHVGSLHDLPVIQGDGQRIKTAVTKVVENAIKYTPDGGSIYIGGRSMSEAVDLSIRDTGIGIPVEERVRIFDKFYVLDPIDYHFTSKTAFRGGGMGLGLTIAKGIIEAHNGRIWVESEQRNVETLPGSTFHILIPLQPPTAELSHSF